MQIGDFAMKFQKTIAILSFIIALLISSVACGFTFETAPVFTPEVEVVLPTQEVEETVAVQLIELTTPLQQPTAAAEPIITTSEEAILVEMYRRINPAVVSVLTYDLQKNIVVSSGQGSGFLYDTNGHIVTNSHVVHGADQVEVLFSNGLSVKGKVIGQDLNSDLAVIKVENVPADAQPIPLGHIEDVAVGQTVVALGNPFGLDGTLTKGIVSALGRTIPALTTFSIPQAIQTDAPINPGNSGGPLLNLKGEVIGVNAQIETRGNSRSNSGVGFAIPVSIISRVVPELITNGKFEWSWLGVVGGNLNSTTREAMGLSVERGAYISEVVNGGPAQLAGLHGSTREINYDSRIIEIGGDVIVGINGVEVSTFEDILIYIALNTIPGQQVDLTIVRDGKTQNVPLTLQPRPPGSSEFVHP
ncbi:MAG: hypothetical protein B6D39_10785 [Anaerolineae bacterium UTCFX2]|nr:MAG: hypothetical protein B6D39_10785 [Anaerolineae bacterium UTCFX2]